MAASLASFFNAFSLAFCAAASFFASSRAAFSSAFSLAFCAAAFLLAAARALRAALRAAFFFSPLCGLFFCSSHFLETAMASSKSFSLHRPIATGFFGRRDAMSRCVPSRKEAIVGLVVPISRQICESIISGQLRSIHKTAAGLSLRWDGESIFLFLLFCALTLRSGSTATSEAAGSFSQRAISSAVS